MLVFALALAAGGTIAALWFAYRLGIRPDILTALQHWRFVAKLTVMLVAFGC